ncbi:hypothetical protein [Pseudomonas sp. Irchel 3E13]|uniref:hypothetical protein n=1 Tax=Pseudomonas sp. Irchel 3E13 TaxID=2008975 RepID=UPI000BA447BC|nr:hypothetical protein [Pseudomonas sp. Irchel 3E13]
MAVNHHGAPTRRVCGHTDVFTFHYRGKQGRASDLNYASSTLCRACGQKVDDWFGYSGKGFHQVALPKLIGRTTGAISWGNRIRIERLRALGPLMSVLKASPDPLAGVVLRVLDMMFQVASASYWIDVEKQGYDVYSLRGDVEILLRGSKCRDNPQPNSSVIGYWLLNHPRAAAESIGYVRESLKAAIAEPVSVELPLKSPGLETGEVSCTAG